MAMAAAKKYFLIRVVIGIGQALATLKWGVPHGGVAQNFARRVAARRPLPNPLPAGVGLGAPPARAYVGALMRLLGDLLERRRLRAPPYDRSRRPQHPQLGDPERPQCRAKLSARSRRHHARRPVLQTPAMPGSVRMNPLSDHHPLGAGFVLDLVRLHIEH